MGKRTTEKNLGDALLHDGFIKPSELEDIEKEVRESGRKFGEVAVSRGYLTWETLVTAMSFFYGASIVDLKDFNPGSKVLALIPEEVAKKNNVLPLTVNRAILTVAMVNPGDSALIDTLSSFSRKRIQPVIPLHNNIKEAIIRHYQSRKKAGGVAKEATSKIAKDLIAAAKERGAGGIILTGVLCMNGDKETEVAFGDLHYTTICQTCESLIAAFVAVGATVEPMRVKITTRE